LTPRRSAVAWLAAVAAALALGACRGGAEHAVIGEFFAASRLLDRTALDNVSTVIFDPRSQGTVSTFSVTDISAERNAGGIPSKEVSVSAEVRSPDGTMTTRPLVLTLQRREGRWLVVGVRPRTP
jgi:acyl-coenzyme A synthetase/AMP-(fatty) acid ligase